MRVSKDLNQNVAYLKGRLHLPENKDVILRSFRALGRSAALFYVEGLASSQQIQQFILDPCLTADYALTRSGDLCQTLVNHVLQTGETDTEQSLDKAVAALMEGKAVLLADTMDAALLLDIRGYVRRSVSQPLTEKVILGPHQGFNESIRDNITLIRRQLETPDLVGEMLTVGESIPTTLCLMYLNGIAPAETVELAKSRLSQLHVDHVSSIGMLEQLLEDRPYSLLPQFCSTERPDRAASFLLEGQVLLVLDGASRVVALPVSLLHLFHTSEDTAARWQYGTFLRLIRLLGALVTLYLPGVFVALCTFHLEIMPLALLTAVLESQATVPLSILVETLAMLILFSLILEAATRIPSVAGSSIGIVAGLIMGQAAVEANLVNPLLIIVIAIGSLGGFAVPNYSLMMAFRLLQLLFTACAGIMGFPGLLGVTLVCLACFAGMDTFGQPFLAPLGPRNVRNPDAFLRLPIWRQRLRTYLANPAEMRRAVGRMRAWDRRDDS